MIGGDRGQATVEVALVLPVLVLLVMSVIQVGTVVHHQVLVSSVAREAARAAAVSEDPDAARRAGAAVGGLDPGHLQVVVGRAGSPASVTAQVSFRSVTDLPVVGRLVPDVDLTAVATMRSET